MLIKIAKVMLVLLPIFLQKRIFTAASKLFKNPDYIWYFGKLMEERGELTLAIDAYQLAADMVKGGETSNRRTHLQRYQFNLARALQKAGKSHEDDPLLEGEIKPGKVNSDPNNSLPGKFDASYKYNGLSISLKVIKPGFEFVELLVDGIVFRTTKVCRKTGKFKFSIRRPALEHFPTHCELSVRASDGSLFTAKGFSTLEMYLPQGRGDIKQILDKYGMLEKKGDIAPSDEEVRNRQNAYLELYARAKEFFDKELGKPLFLIYGTLLGLYREGDFIQGDDDYDVCYISEETDPLAVKKEAKEIIMKLVKAGFTVSFNQAGRPFRLRDGKNNSIIHLDVRPLWYQDGKVWAHKQACLECSLDDFRPFQKTKMRETEVYIPYKPEVFIEAYYGPGWKVPDPSYSNNDAQIEPAVHKTLNKLCLTIADYNQMHSELINQRKEYAKIGDLFFLAAHDLYPLKEYEANCGW